MMDRPDASTLHELLTCDFASGRIWYKPRKREWFDQLCTFVSWNSKYAGKEGFRIVRDNGYLDGSLLNRRVRAHHVIWCMAYGDWPDELDHVNGDRTDNRLSNLRLVDRRENMRNSSLSKRNSSGVIGVQKNRDRWLARIMVDRKSINLGTFVDFNEAVRVRKQAEIEYGFHPNHGKKLCLR